MFHRDEFQHPTTSFIFGALIVIINCVCQVANLLQTLTQETAENVIKKFVAFSLLIQCIDYYYRSRSNFLRIKSCVSNIPLVVNSNPDKLFGRDLTSSTGSVNEEYIKGKNRLTIRILYRIYKILNLFYSTFYFYFFPLTVLIIPFRAIM